MIRVRAAVRRPSQRAEEGSILILALVFLSLFGLVIAALMSQAEVNFKTTLVTRGETDKLFAADGGVEVGVQKLRTTDTLCPNTTAGTQTVTGVPAVNSRTVTVTCRVLAGAVASPAGKQWSLITTGTGVGSLTFQPGAGSTATATIAGGDVLLNGDPTLNGSLSANGADVTRNTAGCTQPGNLTVDAPDLFACGNGVAYDIAHVLPAAPAVRDNPQTVSCGGKSWKILHPGKYTAAAGPEFGSYNYLESGVYYFEDVNVPLNSKVLIGGQPATGEINVLSPACPNDTTAGANSRASGKGVILILGGTSSITLTALAGANDFELFSREPVSGDTSYTAGISVYAVPDNSVSGYKPFTATNALLDNTGIGGVAIHGLIYAPTGNVDIYARNSYAPILGGIVANQLTVRTPAGSTGTVAAVAATGRRTVLLTSSAAGVAAGESATTETAVVKIANDPDRSATVRSWRSQ